MKITLTDRKVESLKAAPKGERYQVMDALVPGFGVRVTDKGVRTYILQARYPGSKNSVRREINRVGVLTLEEARDKAREWLKSIKRGIDPLFVEERERAENVKKRTIRSAASATITSNASWPSSAPARCSGSGSNGT